jgi:hypothetical protein
MPVLPNALQTSVQPWITSSIGYVLPCFDNSLAKKWLHGTTTHQLLFGENYVYNVAFSLNLTSKFSDPGNLLYNAGLVDDNEDPVPATENPQQPKKKRRKKAVTKKDGPEIKADYYKRVNLVKMAMEQPGFTERMAAWHHELCKKCSTKNTNLDGITAANRVSTMHATMENTSRTHSKETADFFRNNLFLSFPALSSQDSSPSGSDTTRPLTQPEPTAV